MNTAQEIAGQLELLNSKDGLVRQKARKALAEIGNPAVPALAQVLQDAPSKNARWGAAKALGEICDPVAIPALLDALEDRDSDVSWLAAVALNKLGKSAWKHILQRLIERGVDSVAVRSGVHHIFKGQQFGEYDELFATLIRALEFGELNEAGSMAATEIHKRMLAGLWQECQAMGTEDVHNDDGV